MKMNADIDLVFATPVVEELLFFLNKENIIGLLSTCEGLYRVRSWFLCHHVVLNTKSRHSDNFKDFVKKHNIKNVVHEFGGYFGNKALAWATDLHFAKFGQPIPKELWTQNVKSVTLEHLVNQKIDDIYLATNLQTLCLGSSFNQPLKNIDFPTSLRSLQFKGLVFPAINYGHQMPNFTQRMELIDAGNAQNVKWKNFKTNTVQLIVNAKHGIPKKIKTCKCVERLHIKDCNMQDKTFSAKNFKQLQIEGEFDHKSIVKNTQNLEKLWLIDQYGWEERSKPLKSFAGHDTLTFISVRNILLPLDTIASASNLCILNLQSDRACIRQSELQNVAWPRTLREMRLHQCAVLSGAILPPNLQLLSIATKFDQPDLAFPLSFHWVEINGLNNHRVDLNKWQFPPQMHTLRLKNLCNGLSRRKIKKMANLKKLTLQENCSFPVQVKCCKCMFYPEHVEYFHAHCTQPFLRVYRCK